MEIALFVHVETGYSPKSLGSKVGREAMPSTAPVCGSIKMAAAARDLEAIRLHSTGAPDMTELDMVVYLADLIEPGRDFDGVENCVRFALKIWKKPWLNLTPIPLNICWTINF